MLRPESNTDSAQSEERTVYKFSEFTAADIDALQAYSKTSLCLSIYAKLINPDPPGNANSIHVKNLLRQSERSLLNKGLILTQATKALQPARQFAESPALWPLHEGALAIFVGNNIFHYFYLPNLSLKSDVITVQKGFNLKPLRRALLKNRPYFLLTLGHKNVRLFKGDYFGLKPVRIRQLPADMKSTLNIDEYPKSRETHTIAPASYGKGSEAYHEQYNVSQTDKVMLSEFFRIIDRRIHSFLRDKQYPLILSGVNYVLPIYRKVNTYPYISKEVIKGNQDRVNLRELNNKAWKLAASL